MEGFPLSLVHRHCCLLLVVISLCLLYLLVF